MVSSIISCRGAEADSHGLAIQQTIVLPTLQYIDKVVDVFVQVHLVVRSCGNSRYPTVQLVLFVFGPGRRHSCRGADADSLGPVTSLFSSCSTLIRWSTFFVQVQQFSSAHVEETAELPQLRRFAWTLALHMPVVVQRQAPYGR